MKTNTVISSCERRYLVQAAGRGAGEQVAPSLSIDCCDPDQPGGAPLTLPDDAALTGDLTAPTFDVGTRGILLEDKDAIKERLGRSPDRGDAVVMAWSEGQAALRRGLGGGSSGGGERQAYANVGYTQMKRRRIREQ